MTRWTTLLLLLLATALGSLSFGSAASLRVSSDELSSGVYESSIVVTECSLDHAATSVVVRDEAAGEIPLAIGVSIDRIDAGCRGEQVVVTAIGADGTVVSRAIGVITTVGGASMSLPLDVVVPAALIATTDLALAR